MSTTTDHAPLGERLRRPAAAWTLVLLAPLVAEATFSGISTPIILLALPLLVPIYGAGVLLIREAVRRTGAGWPGLLVLGLAYELAEDGLGLQALTSPRIYGAAAWGPQAFGLNLTYWQSQIGYHVVFTVLVPVALTELLFRRHGRRPYVGPVGLATAGIVFVAGVVLLRVGISATEDPGYRTPGHVMLGLIVAIAVLVVIALVVLPRLPRPRPVGFARPPRPVVAAVTAGLATVVFLGLLFPLGHGSARPAVGDADLVPAAMVVALAIALGVGWLVARWCATDGFDDHHRVWLVGGALVGHTLYALASGVAGGSVVPAVVIAVVVLAATVMLLRRLDR